MWSRLGRSKPYTIREFLFEKNTAKLRYRALKVAQMIGSETSGSFSFIINPPLPTSLAPLFFYLSPSISAQKALPIPLCLDNSFSTQLPILPETPVGLGTSIESPKPQASPQSSLSGRRCSFSTFKRPLAGRGLLLKCVSGRGPGRERAGVRSLFGPEA